MQEFFNKVVGEEWLKYESRELILDNLPLKINTTNKRNPVYVKEGTRQYYKDGQLLPEYTIEQKGKKRIICFKGQPIIKNKNLLDTPRTASINLQQLYRKAGYTMDKVLKTLHNYYEEECLRKNYDLVIPASQILIGYRFEVKREEKKHEFDVDNFHWLYVKAFHDFLKKKNLWDDNSKVLPGYFPYVTFGESNTLTIWIQYIPKDTTHL